MALTARSADGRRGVGTVPAFVRPVLRTIGSAGRVRSRHPLKIVYLDPYLSPSRAYQNIAQGIRRQPEGTDWDFTPTPVDWTVEDGYSELLKSLNITKLALLSQSD